MPSKVSAMFQVSPTSGVPARVSISVGAGSSSTAEPLRVPSAARSRSSP